MLTNDIDNTQTDELLNLQEILPLKEFLFWSLNQEIEAQISDLKEYEKHIASS